jgi:hypothetical protein
LRFLRKRRIFKIFGWVKMYSFWKMMWDWLVIGRRKRGERESGERGWEGGGIIRR